MPKKAWWILVPIAILSLYFLGPHPSTPLYDSTLPVVPDITSIDGYVRSRESEHKLRPDNEARIVWADSAGHLTRYSILYLHGFSASQGEGDPVHRYIAKKYRCNLYLSRLAEHGIDTTEKLINLTADKMWESAKEAYAIASRLGQKVIVMGTSTGASLALMLAAKYPEIHSLILLSPNIEIFDKNAWLVNNPWGLEIGRMVNGSDYVLSEDTRPLYKQYWSYGYRIEAVAQLEEMLETAMTNDVFNKVKQPVLMLYYYRDPIHQDSVVKVDAMLKMYSELGTPSNKKRSASIPGAGNHVIGSYIKSRDVESVKKEIEKFVEEVLDIK
jgi:esterase/lipase